LADPGETVRHRRVRLLRLPWPRGGTDFVWSTSTTRFTSIAEASCFPAAPTVWRWREITPSSPGAPGLSVGDVSNPAAPQTMGFLAVPGLDAPGDLRLDRLGRGPMATGRKSSMSSIPHLRRLIGSTVKSWPKQLHRPWAAPASWPRTTWECGSSRRSALRVTAVGRTNPQVRVEPRRFALAPNRPVRGHAALHLMLPESGTVSLTILDPSGRSVRRIFEGPLAHGSMNASGTEPTSRGGTRPTESTLPDYRTAARRSRQRRRSFGEDSCVDWVKRHRRRPRTREPTAAVRSRSIPGQCFRDSATIEITSAVARSTA